MKLLHTKSEHKPDPKGLSPQKRRDRISRAQKCAQIVRKRLDQDLPGIALVLGSGFQEVLSGIKVHSEVSFSELPGFAVPGVKGHPGRLALGRVAGVTLLICCGRSHYYEGHSMETVMHPIDVLAQCGVCELLLTNAAGSINERYQPGEFMLFEDHINMVGVNPLRGFPVDDGRCFVDLTNAYCPQLRAELKAAARRERIPLREGVYLGVSGPSYETPAEIRAFRRLGADAVGMSTIPEVLVARYHGMRVAAISCLTNYGAGMRRGKLSHAEVLQVGSDSAMLAGRLLNNFARSRSGKKNLRKG